MNLALIESNHIKGYYNRLQLFIKQLSSEGVQFYSFTVCDQDEMSLAPGIVKAVHNSLVQIPLIELCYTTIEQHESGLAHYHGLIGIRSFIGYNESLILELENFLLIIFEDLKLDHLTTHKDRNQFIRYMLKENKFDQQFFTSYDNNYEHEVLSFVDSAHTLAVHLDRKTTSYGHIRGCGNKEKGKLVGKIIYLFNVYLQLNDMFIYKHKIMVKEPKSRYTYTYFNHLSFFKDDYATILNFLAHRFPFHFKYLDLHGMMIDALNLAYRNLLDAPNLLYHSTVNYNVIEFSDGLLILGTDTFIYHHNIKRPLNVRPYKFFNIAYRSITEPTIWLSTLSANTDLNTAAKLNQFCADLGRYFYTSDLDVFKQTTLFLHGASNTGKSQLVTNIIIEARGIENVGTINSNSKEFALEKTLNKLVIVCDEFKYNPFIREDLLKLINGEPLSINAKFEKHTDLSPTKSPVIIISNKIEEEMLNDFAFRNRLILYTFDCILSNSNIKNSLKNELAQIIVYCNKQMVLKHGNVNKSVKKHLFLEQEKRYLLN